MPEKCPKCGEKMTIGAFNKACPKCDLFWFEPCRVCREVRVFCVC